MLGAFAIFHGPENDRAAQLGRPKINDLQLAYSRDGFHWHRPHREAFIGASRRWGSWNYGYVHAAGGVCLVVGDELWFYYGAFSGQGSIFKPGESGKYPHDNAMYAGGHTGLATLRRDGFASMEADGEGELETRPLKFSGQYLFVNIDAPARRTPGRGNRSARHRHRAVFVRQLPRAARRQHTQTRCMEWR